MTDKEAKLCFQLNLISDITWESEIAEDLVFHLVWDGTKWNLKEPVETCSEK